MSIISVTASTMVRVLERLGGEVSAQQFQSEVAAEGGDPAYIQFAAKWLRDRGVPLATRRKGPNTVWFLPEAGPDARAYFDQEVKNMFSEAVSIARSSSGVRGSGVKVARDKAVTNAVVLGERLGYSPAEVLAMCAPLTGP